MPAILFDSNVWVALTFSAHPLHAEARKLFATATPDSPAVFCRPTEISFLRLSTTPALLDAYGCPEITNRDALGFLQRYRKLKQVGFLEEPPNAREKWLKLGEIPSASPKAWMDAYLAAVALTGGLAFVTTDSGFRRFEKAEDLQLTLLQP